MQPLMLLHLAMQVPASYVSKVEKPMYPYALHSVSSNSRENYWTTYLLEALALTKVLVHPAGASAA